MKEEDVRKTLQEHEIPNGFIKVTEKPLTTLNIEQKAQLNRKGNVLFNQDFRDDRIFRRTEQNRRRLHEKR